MLTDSASKSEGVHSKLRHLATMPGVWGLKAGGLLLYIMEEEYRCSERRGPLPSDCSELPNFEC